VSSSRDGGRARPLDYPGRVPTIVSHAVVAVCAGRAVPRLDSMPRRFWAIVAGLAMLPDLDVIAFALGVPYGSPWGHRGASHSLAAAAAVGLLAALAARRALPLPWPLAWACFGAAMASHGILDALTDGGSGVAFLFPFDDTRYFAPWRPLRVSPIGLDFFGPWGWATLESEALWLGVPAAALLVAGALRRRARRAGRGSSRR
jgi:inner membrane protein